MLRSQLRGVIAFLNTGSSLADIMLVDPGEARAHLLKVGVDTLDKDDGQRSAVSIQAVRVKFDLTPEIRARSNAVSIVGRMFGLSPARQSN